MFTNTLKVAWRTIRKNRGYSFLNIAGLAVGMAVCILILFWARDELGFDRFHENAEDIFVVYSDYRYSDGRTEKFTTSYYPLARAIKEDCPEVREAVRIMEATGVVITRGDKAFTDDTILLADSEFFSVFSFPFVKGDPKTAFTNPYGTVITETAARKYFGEEDPLGKTLAIAGEIDILVSGVLKDAPANSSIRFDLVVPFHFAWGSPEGSEPQHWGGNPLNTYVLLQSGADLPSVEQKITAAVNRRMKISPGMAVTMGLQSLTRMHLYSLEGGGPILLVAVFCAVALLVLITACFNFVNLTTARASVRTNEVGIRKAAGAGRKDLIRQFLGESLLTTLVAFLAAVLLASLTLPLFNSLSGKQLSLQGAGHVSTLAGLIAIALVTGLFAGIYPALFLSSLRPARLFQSTSSLRPKGSFSRKAFIVVQYGISIFLILGTLTVHRQLGLMNTMDLGYDKNNLLLVDLPAGLRSGYDALKQELLRIPGVKAVSRSAQTLDYINSTVSALDWEGKDPGEKVSMNWDYVGYDYFETMGMTILEGRGFSRSFPSDLGKAYVVNEEAVRLMGLDSPIGRRLSVFRNEGTIIGVVKDFHFKPLHHHISPIVFGMDPDWLPNMRSLFVRLEPGRLAESLRSIEETYKSFSSGSPFTYSFFDEMTRRHYQAEQKMERIVGAFTLLALFISCFGLLGLASFTADRRTKEIGIRKVLGASSGKLVFLLTGEFVKWVLVANLLAWPAAYLAASNWLRHYAYRVDLGFWIFLGAAGVSFAISIITVGTKALRVASANPVDALRYE